MVSEENEDSGGTMFDLTFDQTVTVSRSFYPPLSFTDLFSKLGGSLGLWLGVGMMQMCITLTTVLFKLKKFLIKA